MNIKTGLDPRFAYLGIVACESEEQARMEASRFFGVAPEEIELVKFERKSGRSTWYARVKDRPQDDSKS